MSNPSLPRRMFAEALGTFILVLFGCGSVHAAVLAGAQQGVWQVAIVWGVAVMLAIYTIGAVSGAHINPAMTVALAVWRKFPWPEVPCYAAAQCVGAFVAAGSLFVMYEPHLRDKEVAKQVERGEPGSIITAMCYGEYYPNPGVLAAGSEPYSAERHEVLQALVTHGMAFGIEVLGTAVLAFVVFAVTDARNSGRPAHNLAPVFIGLTVAVLISIIGPLTQACFNPARDFGPRVFAAIAGWGRVAWPIWTDWSWLTVYILAPIVGAAAGGGVYDRTIGPTLAANGEVTSP